MRKLFTLCFGLIAALAAQAQSDFPLQFADKDGNIIADGTVLNITDIVTDDFGDVLMPSGLYMKNTSNAEVRGGGRYTIESISNGVFQTCFPVNCVQQKAKGTFETGSDAFAAGILKYMQTEWLPTAEGKVVVKYQLLTYKQNPITKDWLKDKEGPTVTLSFDYNTASVDGTKGAKAVSKVVYYNVLGHVISKPAHGVYVKKTLYADGSETTQKQMMR